jgi:hypothetical protein
MAEENRKLKPMLSPEQTNRMAQGYLPKESWAFVGFKTPEDAFQSSAWAVEHHDIKALLDCMTPRLVARFTDTNTAEGLNKVLFFSLNGIGNTSEVKEYKVVHTDVRSEDELILQVWYGDYYEHGRVVGNLLKRVDGQWKLAAQSGAQAEP